MRLIIKILTVVILAIVAEGEAYTETEHFLLYGDSTSTVKGEDCIDLLRTHLVRRPVMPDSSDVARLSHKSFWRAGAETVGMNLGLWAFDRYALKGHYAYISWETIKENFKHGFEWDNDHLSTNMFAHPYNGSIYYNAGRSNGYNYWQSALFAIGGSAMWEMFMECEYPSTNDIIATPIGGTAIGEVLYRTSDMVIDERVRGWERAGRELASFILSPARGFTRIVTGRAWQSRATTGRRFGIPPVSVTLSLGARMLLVQNSIVDEDRLKSVLGGATGRILVEYGDRFAAPTALPYDYFTFRLNADVMKDQPGLSELEIIGRLLSRPLIDKTNVDLTLGLYQHYDYFDSDTIDNKTPSLFYPCDVPYKFGTPASIGGGLQFRYTLCPYFEIDAYTHVNAVLMGGILSDFYRYYNRNYNWGSGFSLKGGIGLKIPKIKLRGGVDAKMYRLYTWNGRTTNPDIPPNHPDNIQGDRSNATFFNLNAHIDYKIWRRLYATAMIDWYRRYTTYPGRKLVYPLPGGDAWLVMNLVTSNQLGLKIMLTYEL